MEEKQWVCSCGTENTGNYCSFCGRAREDSAENASPDPSPADLYARQMAEQMKQQELLNQKQQELEAEKHNKEVEFANKRNEYEKKCAEIPLRELKKWGSSWVVLVLTVLSALSVILALASFVVNITSSTDNILGDLITIFLSVLVCIGFWRSYKACKSDETFMNLGGPRMLRGVCRFYQIVTYIIMAITILVLFFFLATGKDFIEQAIIASNQQDEDLSLVLKYFNGIIIGALVVVAIVFVFCIIYYSSVLKFAKTRHILHGNQQYTSAKRYLSGCVPLFIRNNFAFVLLWVYSVK